MFGCWSVWASRFPHHPCHCLDEHPSTTSQYIVVTKYSNTTLTAIVGSLAIYNTGGLYIQSALDWALSSLPSTFHYFHPPTTTTHHHNTPRQSLHAATYSKRNSSNAGRWLPSVWGKSEQTIQRFGMCCSLLQLPQAAQLLPLQMSGSGR